MGPQLFLTADGSHSLRSGLYHATYHSVHGALTESMHIFIRSGLHAVWKRRKELKIFEMGFGTGLNALLTAIECEKEKIQLYYFSVEMDPLDPALALQLNYPRLVPYEKGEQIFHEIHRCAWNRDCQLRPGFVLHKSAVDLTHFIPQQKFDLIYFDAFDPSVQPQLWDEKTWQLMFQLLEPGGTLVTYSVKGSVRRAIAKSGFSWEKLPGPPNKKEILRAVRPA